RIPQAGLFERVTVQISNVRRDPVAFRVKPGPLADAIARVHGARTLSTQICVPLQRAARGLSERLAVLVGSRYAAEIRSIAFADAGYEERHWWRRGLRLTVLTLVLRDRRNQTEREQGIHSKNQMCFPHVKLLFFELRFVQIRTRLAAQS